jgi:hypothetical protein
MYNIHYKPTLLQTQKWLENKHVTDVMLLFQLNAKVKEVLELQTASPLPARDKEEFKGYKFTVIKKTILVKVSSIVKHAFKR